MNSKPDYYNDLQKTYSKIWDLLKYGLDDRNAPFHIPVFVCGGIDKPEGRVVVLRGVDHNECKIWFHTDIRSDKIKILKTNPKASFLFYDKAEKVQLRISVISKISYQNDLTKKSWEKTAHMSRQCYLGEKAPGEISASGSTSGLSESIDNLKYSIEESEEGYKNFCVVENFVKSIEWLYLAAKGHRRAKFEIESNNKIKMFWKIP